MGRPFQKGQSGNPGGQRKSLVTEVRALVGHDGEQLVALWWLIAQGSDVAIRERLGMGKKAPIKLRDRLLALRELGDRGFGKPPQEVDLSDPHALLPTIIHEYAKAQAHAGSR